jgi:hypothetical protein
MAELERQSDIEPAFVGVLGEIKSFIVHLSACLQVNNILVIGTPNSSATK